jgi:large conductance mechanosensitive channel
MFNIKDLKMVNLKNIVGKFGSFALKKTILATAVGLSIGTAFNKIVASFVTDLVMPLFIAYVGMDKFKNLKYVLVAEYTDQDAIKHAEVAIKYGNLFEAIINFLIVALGVFLFYHICNHLWQSEEEKEA